MVSLKECLDVINIKYTCTVLVYYFISYMFTSRFTVYLSIYLSIYLSV